MSLSEFQFDESNTFDESSYFNFNCFSNGNENTGSFWIPGTEGLIPINPVRYSGQVMAGTVFNGKGDTIWKDVVAENFNTILTYIEGAGMSDTEWLARLQHVITDEVAYNALLESGFGGEIAGSLFASVAAESYEREITFDESVIDVDSPDSS